MQRAIGAQILIAALFLPATGRAEGLAGPPGTDSSTRLRQQRTCLANVTGEVRHVIGLNDDLAALLFKDKDTKGFLARESLSGPRLIQEGSDGVLSPITSIFNVFRTDDITNRFVLCLLMYGYRWESSSKDGPAQIADLATAGNAPAQSTLGLMYYHGHGLPLNQTLAVEWIRKAAEQDYGLAQYNLAIAYIRGEGVAVDPNEAVKWLRKAAAKGNSLAQQAIEEVDRKGQAGLVPTTPASEVASLDRSSSDDPKAMAELAAKYEDGSGVRRDMEKAISLYRKSADLGYVPAQGYLGVIYDKGRGVPQDDVEALKWYRLAAEKGYAQSQFNLGVFLVTGRGTTRNEEEGWNWIRKAAAGGHEGARAAVARNHK